MKVIDYNMVIAISEHWKSKVTSVNNMCPLLADLDRLLAYLDEKNITPGNVIDPCPECGQEHRWAMLNRLMVFALDIRDSKQSCLLEKVDNRLEHVRALYGGKEGYKNLQTAAKEYFKGADGNVYTP